MTALGEPRSPPLRPGTVRSPAPEGRARYNRGSARRRRRGNEAELEMVAVVPEVQVRAPRRGRTERRALPGARVQPAAVPAVHDVEIAVEAVSIRIDRVTVDRDVVGSVRDGDPRYRVDHLSGRNPAFANRSIRGRLTVHQGHVVRA